MGQPNGRNGPLLLPECIGQVEGTRGSETSQYPLEEKSIEIPSVAASERGIAQTKGSDTLGVVGLSQGQPGESSSDSPAEGAWKGPPKTVIVR